MKAILLAIAILIGFPAYAESPCSVKLSPTGFQSARRVNAHITVHIDRNAGNRGATLELVSEDYYTRSDFDVEGELAPVTWNFDRRDLGAGTYVAYLTLHRLVGGDWKNFTAESEKLIVLD